MAQKFKFKLDALLKVREFKEKKIMLELGEILREIEKAKEVIAKAQQDIEECYTAQEEFISTPSAGRMVQFFPQFIKTKRDQQENQNNLIYALNKKYESKLRELATAKGEVKVIDNLKEKQHDIHKKETAKKFQENIDELTLARRHRESENE